MKTKSIKAVAVVLAAVMTFTLIGCLSQATLAALTSTLGNAASALAVMQGDPALATQIRTDTAAAVTAIQNWKKGTPAQNVIQVLGIVQDDLNLIPFAAPYIPLISLALVTVQEIITIITANSPTPVMAHKPKVDRQPRVYYTGKIPKNDSQFKKQWNAIVAANPQLAPTAIQ